MPTSLTTRRMLVFCDEQEQSGLTSMLAGLEGLHLVSGVAIDDATGVASAVAQHALDATEAAYALQFDRDQLFLCKADGRGRFGRARVAFENADLQRRTGALSEIQKAVFGQAPGEGVRVLDVFAGWGMDAWALASRGASVDCVELQPAMVALLRDAARRVPVELASRLTISQGHAIDTLQELDASGVNGVDVIYLDPMFPARKKGALPGKRLQWLADIANSPVKLDTEKLVELAMRKAMRHVVLKRRRKDAVLEVKLSSGARSSVVKTPVRQVVGSSVRYDIYAPIGGSS